MISLYIQDFIKNKLIYDSIENWKTIIKYKAFYFDIISLDK